MFMSSIISFACVNEFDTNLLVSAAAFARILSREALSEARVFSISARSRLIASFNLLVSSSSASDWFLMLSAFCNMFSNLFLSSETALLA